MIYNRLKIWLRVLKAFTLTFNGVKSSIDDASATVDAIINGKSLIRFGDGEFGIYRGHDIHYQPWSEDLHVEFQKIKNDFESQAPNCRYILAVPKNSCNARAQNLGKSVYLCHLGQNRDCSSRNHSIAHSATETHFSSKRKTSIYINEFGTDRMTPAP